jgi:hypothetical protein
MGNGVAVKVSMGDDEPTRCKWLKQSVASLLVAKGYNDNKK